MATLLLDSTVIFDSLNFKRGRREYLTQLPQEGHILASCPINFIEVYAGLRDHEKAHTEQFLGSLKFHPITAQAAKEAGLLKREWQRKGQTLAPIRAPILVGRRLTMSTRGRSAAPKIALTSHHFNEWRSSGFNRWSRWLLSGMFAGS